MMTKRNNEQRSKYLSYLLRHKPQDAKLDIDPNGWVSVSQLVENTDFTLDLLEEIVTTCSKQRYEFNDDKSKIRARQGHSVEVDLAYKQKTPPELLYHGTAKSNFYDIWCGGLNKMKRHHVHLSQDIETAKKVGQRHGSPIILVVNSYKMNMLGYKFFLTANNIWLTDSVPRDFISVHLPDGILKFY